MELLQLRYFCNAAKCGSFAAVADAYRVPRSGVSQSIARLEKELESKLFERSANRILLTEAGRVFYERVAAALCEIDGACSELRDTREPETVRICINSNRRLVMAAIEAFQKKYPDVRIVARHGAAPDSEPFDLIVSNDTISDRYDSYLLLSEEIALAFSSDSALSGVGEITPSLLSAQSFVTMSEPNSLYRFTVDVCRSLGFTPKIAIQSDDPFYVRRCVELGLGVAFVPLISWQGLFDESVQFKRIGQYRRDTYLLCPKAKRTPKHARSLADALLLECRRAGAD